MTTHAINAAAAAAARLGVTCISPKSSSCYDSLSATGLTVHFSEATGCVTLQLTKLPWQDRSETLP